MASLANSIKRALFTVSRIIGQRLIPDKNLITFILNSGIHVLRIMKYDRQALAMRRLQCENSDSDPIVWTNQKFIRWARSIDLGEYADNLKGKLLYHKTPSSR